MHKEIGFNYRLTNLQAALGVSQLKRIDAIIEKKTSNGEEADKGKNLIKRPKIIAIKKFTAGPAIATFKSPCFRSRKLLGFIGTGFAQPKIGPLPKVATSIINGKRIEPKGSMWLMGFNVNLPSYFAVGSPKLYATAPCATSCKITENKRMIK